jgi:hypothetical protein
MPLGLRYLFPVSAPETDLQTLIETNPFVFDETADYVSEDGRLELHHKDGVPWYQAPAPPRRHTCWAQTDGWTNWVNRVERCACGAIRYDGAHGVWMERNSRTDSPPAKSSPPAGEKRGFLERLADRLGI